MIIFFKLVNVINTLRPKQNGRHFADDIFKCIFLNENVWIPNNISLEFVPKGPINNNPALVQVMAWRRPGDKPLSEPMMVRLPTHTMYMCHSASMNYSHLVYNKYFGCVKWLRHVETSQYFGVIMFCAIDTKEISLYDDIFVRVRPGVWGMAVGVITLWYIHETEDPN